MAANPGQGHVWRYGQLAEVMLPKTGSTGDGSFWRYGQVLDTFVAAAGGPTTYNDSRSGAISPTGALQKAMTDQPHQGAASPAGAITKQVNIRIGAI